MADFITPLQWIPTSKQIRGRKLHDEMVEVYGALLLGVKARMDAGEDVPDCLAKTLWQIRDQENLDWEDMCMLTAVFVLGGVHSVRNVLFMNITIHLPIHNRLPELFSGSLPFSHPTLMSHVALTRNWTTLWVRITGLQQRMRADSHISERLSKRYEELAICDEYLLMMESRFNVFTLHSGWRLHTIQPRTSFTRAFSSPRIQHWS